MYLYSNIYFTVLKRIFVNILRQSHKITSNKDPERNHKSSQSN